MSIIELGGVIKSFDLSKGYGIIVLDNGTPDILLSVACLRRGGFEVAYEGAGAAVLAGPASVPGFLNR